MFAVGKKAYLEAVKWKKSNRANAKLCKSPYRVRFLHRWTKKLCLGLGVELLNLPSADLMFLKLLRSVAGRLCFAFPVHEAGVYDV